MFIRRLLATCNPSRYGLFGVETQAYVSSIPKFARGASLCIVKMSKKTTANNSMRCSSISSGPTDVTGDNPSFRPLRYFGRCGQHVARSLARHQSPSRLQRRNALISAFEHFTVFDTSTAIVGHLVSGPAFQLASSIHAHSIGHRIDGAAVLCG